MISPDTIRKKSKLLATRRSAEKVRTVRKLLKTGVAVDKIQEKTRASLEMIEQIATDLAYQLQEKGHTGICPKHRCSLPCRVCRLNALPRKVFKDTDDELRFALAEEHEARRKTVFAEMRQKTPEELCQP